MLQKNTQGSEYFFVSLPARHVAYRVQIRILLFKRTKGCRFIQLPADKIRFNQTWISKKNLVWFSFINFFENAGLSIEQWT
jgi:hypothetical protein